MYRLHDNMSSGNAYKVRLLLSQLGIPFERIEYDIDRAETRTAEFLAKNPNGRVPLLEWEDGRVLPESNAIIWHLAEGSRLMPDGSWSRAEALSWMFFEQYSHEPYVAVARFYLAHAPKDELKKREHLVPEWHAKGNAALAVMEGHLNKRDWFAGARYSVGDIALFGYTHCAEEGGFDLGNYPAITRWIERVREQPAHISLSAR